MRMPLWLGRQTFYASACMQLFMRCASHKEWCTVMEKSFKNEQSFLQLEKRLTLVDLVAYLYKNGTHDSSSRRLHVE